MADDKDDNEKNEKKDREEFRASNLLGEAAKKLFTVGVTAAFMTEEGVRSYLSEVKLPKDILNMVLQGANKSKDELTHRIGREVIGMIQKIDFVSEASRFAENHKFKITAEIEITKKDDKTLEKKSHQSLKASPEKA